MPKEVEFPKLTEIQVELWLGDPVTINYLRCLDWLRLDTRDAAGSGELIDSSSADLTHALLHRALGRQDAYVEASNPEQIFDRYVMIEHPEPEEKDDE